MQHEIGQVSRIGNRSINQDRCGVETDEDSVILVIADGLGGHPKGELAAQIFVDTLCERFRQATHPIKNPQDFLRDSIEQAHAAIIETGLKQKPPIYPCTTCVTCLVQQGEAWWAHVGDSRLYLFRNAEVLFQSRDHSHVEDLYQKGLISRDQMRGHPMRNYVNRCLGIDLDCPQIEEGHYGALQNEDILVLCTDGMWSTLSDENFTQVFNGRNVQSGLNVLAMQAERAAHPKSDNVTAVGLRVKSERTHEAEAVPSTREGDAEDDINDAIEEIQNAIHVYEKEMKEDKS